MWKVIERMPSHKLKSTPLTCSALLKCERKRAETSYGFKKNVENIIFWGYFHSKENIVKVILLFTRSYFSKDNSLMARKEGELKGLHCRGSGPGGIVLLAETQNSVFCVLFFFFCLKAI